MSEAAEEEEEEDDESDMKFVQAAMIVCFCAKMLHCVLAAESKTCADPQQKPADTVDLKDLAHESCIIAGSHRSPSQNETALQCGLRTQCRCFALPGSHQAVTLSEGFG